MRYLSFLLLAVIFISCKDLDTINILKKGNYRMVLDVQDNEELPFIFEVTSDSTLTIFNADLIQICCAHVNRLSTVSSASFIFLHLQIHYSLFITHYSLLAFSNFFEYLFLKCF